MPTAPAAAKPQKAKKEKEKEKERKLSQPPQTERLKTVVRRLPPNLPEDIFWQSVQPWVTEETATWKIFYPGKLRKKLNKENIPSRAYIAFKNEEELANFSREYDGHVFRDKTGAESQAIVEFAPYPKVPSEKRKPDNRSGTIEKDEDYISFLEALKASENAEPVTLESLIASSQPAPHPKTTPLLEALKAEKTANKDKEAILRHHAHYNQIMTGSSRKEEKKKAVPSAPSRPAEPPAINAPVSSGKRSGKKGQTPAAGPAPASQNAKAAPTSSAGPQKNAPSNAPTGSQPGKPPKPPRPPRAAPQAKPVAAPVTLASQAPSMAVVTGLPTPPGSTTPVPAPSNRRTRPVIGLASRQFEAALSGVSGLASAASERKKREKEKEAQSTMNIGAGPSIDAASSTVNTYARIDGSDTEKPALPPSPRKERTRRGGRGGGGGGGGVASSDAPSATSVKVPSILQRADGPPPGIIQRDTSGPSSGAATAVAVVSAPSTPTTNPPVNIPGGSTRGGGGGRRGRGAGRGRGGPAGVPRGGG